MNTGVFWMVYRVPLILGGIVAVLLLYLAIRFVSSAAQKYAARHPCSSVNQPIDPEVNRILGMPAPRPGPGSGQESPAVADTSHPLYGVRGWLRFWILVQFTINPGIFVFGQAFAWKSYLDLQFSHPGVIPVAIIDTVISTCIILYGIQAALRLHGIQPGAVRAARTFIKLTLAWSILGVPLWLLSGLDHDLLLMDGVRSVFRGLVYFAVWHAYFRVSRRVRATYPDWDR